MLGKSGFSNKILIFLSLVRIKNLCLIAECPAVVVASSWKKKRFVMINFSKLWHIDASREANEDDYPNHD